VVRAVCVEVRSEAAELTGALRIMACAILSSCSRPFEVPEGMTAFASLWDFLRDHPYWLNPGQSPYITEGMAASMPTWCAIGAGNAIPPAEVYEQNECS